MSPQTVCVYPVHVEAMLTDFLISLFLTNFLVFLFMHICMYIPQIYLEVRGQLEVTISSSTMYVDSED